jgi:hypothetical protein
MKLSNEEQARLERIIASGLAAQPTLTAPPTLRSRVWSELERRAALPWWHRSFGHWPMTMQAALVLAALAVVRFALNVTVWADATHAATQIAAPVSGRLSGLHALGSAYTSLAALIHGLGESVLHRIPALWLYAGIGALITMYVMLAGIGVAVYRTVDRAHTPA